MLFRFRLAGSASTRGHSNAAGGEQLGFDQIAKPNEEQLCQSVAILERARHQLLLERERFQAERKKIKGEERNPRSRNCMPASTRWPCFRGNDCGDAKNRTLPRTSNLSKGRMSASAITMSVFAATVIHAGFSPSPLIPSCSAFGAQARAAAARARGRRRPVRELRG